MSTRFDLDPSRDAAALVVGGVGVVLLALGRRLGRRAPLSVRILRALDAAWERRNQPF